MSSMEKKVYVGDVLTAVCMYCDSHIEMCDTCPIKDAILDSPDADEDEAEWIEDEFCGGVYVTCSHCHNCYVEKAFLSEQKWNYCPQCGKRLRKETEE